ncbi:unnamed protein product [Calicophoron daubneyi]
MFGGQTTNWVRDAGSDPPRSFVHPSADRNCMFTAACGISRNTRPEDDDEPEALSNTSESDDVCMDSSSQDSLTGGTPVSLQRRLLRSTELSPASSCEIPDNSAGSSSHCRLRTALLNSSRHFSAHSPTFEARAPPPPTALSAVRSVHSLSPSNRTLVISRRASDRELQFYSNPASHPCPPEVSVPHSKEDCLLRSPPCSPDSAQADGVTNHKPLFYFNPSPENEMSSESESHPRPASPSVGMRRIFSETCLEKAFPVAQPLSQPQSPGPHHRRSSLQLSSYRLPMKKRKLDWNIVSGNHTEASIPESCVSSSCSSSRTPELAFPALAKTSIKECSNTGLVTTQGAPNPLIIDRPVDSSEGSQNGKTPSVPSIIMDSPHHHDISSLSSSSEYVRCHGIPSGVNTYTVAKSSGNACDKGHSASCTDGGGATGNPSWNVLSMPSVPKSTSSHVLHNSDSVPLADSAEMNDKNSNSSHLSVLARTLKAVDSERSVKRNFGSFVSSSSTVPPSAQSSQFNHTLSRPEGSTAEELVRNLCSFGDSFLLSNLFASATCNLQSPQQTSTTHPSARPINGRSPKISPSRSFHQPSLKQEDSSTFAGDAVSDMVRHLAYPNSINKSRNSVPPRLSRCNTAILEPTPLVTDPRLIKIKKRFSVGANLDHITTMPISNAQQFSYLPNNGDRLSPSAEFSRFQPDNISYSSNGSRAKTPLAFRPKFRITPPEEERDPLFDGGSFGTSIQPPIDCVSGTGSSLKPSLKSRSSPQKTANPTEKPQVIHADKSQFETEQTSTGAQILMMLSPTSPFAQVQSESNACSAPLAIQLSASSIGNIAENMGPDSALSLNKCSFTRSSFSHLGSSFPLLLVSASSSASAAALAAAAALATGAPPTSLVPVPVQLTSFIPAPSNSEENPNQPSNQLKSQFPQQQRIVLSLCTTGEHEPISRRLPPSASLSDGSQLTAPTRPSP